MKALRPYQDQAVNECWEALRANDEPVLLMASVGAGKSLMMASILLSLQKSGKRALCLVNNADLVVNNSDTFKDQGGDCAIYCASLNSKACNAPVVFGMPQSVINGIKKNKPIAKIKFNIIIVDEAHAINFNAQNSTFMQILRHYKRNYESMRLLGATGTNFRFKGTPIVGNDCLFKSQVGNITIDYLIENGWLIKPTFEIDEKLVIDFSKVKVKSNGQFNDKELAAVVNGSVRLTNLICQQIVHIMESQKRKGIFIFASTAKHALEIFSYLPQNESGIILGGTLQDERTELITKARKGEIRYLVNIGIVSVGVDIPSFDTLAYLRPTESLVFMVQTMGRILRLSECTGKKESLVLDFAGNIERHSDWDNPLLLDALKSTVDKDKPLVICCPACNQMNTDSARRCIGLAQEKRCAYYFEFKECVHLFDGYVCGAKNDLVARECHRCHGELIDPNAKLSLPQTRKIQELRVLRAQYILSDALIGCKIICNYLCQDTTGSKGVVSESFYTSSKKASMVFYGQFVKKHCDKPSKWYPYLQFTGKMEEMIQEAKTPDSIVIFRNQSMLKIKNKIFSEGGR